jgi:hypothetical protein
MGTVLLIALLLIFFIFVLPISLAVKNSKRSNNRIKKINDSLYERTMPGCIDGKSLTYHYDKVKIVILRGQEPDFRSVTPGDDISLILEPENTYDKRAIAVYSKNIKLGYIYKGNMQDMIHDFILRGDPIISCVSSIDDGNKIIYILLAFYRLKEYSNDDENDDSDDE